LILAAPWLGLLLYYLLPRRLQLRRLRRVRLRGARLREMRPRSPGATVLPPPPVGGAPGLRALLRGPDGDGLVGGNAVH